MIFLNIKKKSFFFDIDKHKMTFDFLKKSLINNL
jgi:hypothetical protein